MNKTRKRTAAFKIDDLVVVTDVHALSIGKYRAGDLGIVKGCFKQGAHDYLVVEFLKRPDYRYTLYRDEVALVPKEAIAETPEVTAIKTSPRRHGELLAGMGDW